MMRQLQRILLIVLGLALGFGAHGYAVASADAVTGLWRDDGSILWVQRVDDTLAQLIALRPGETHYGEDEQTSWPIGSPRRDDNNPDPKSARPIADGYCCPTISSQKAFGRARYTTLGLGTPIPQL